MKDKVQSEWTQETWSKRTKELFVSSEYFLYFVIKKDNQEKTKRRSMGSRSWIECWTRGWWGGRKQDSKKKDTSRKWWDEGEQVKANHLCSKRKRTEIKAGHRAMIIRITRMMMISQQELTQLMAGKSIQVDTYIGMILNRDEDFNS